MTPESMGHDLTRNDPADQPRCPMESLQDRFNFTKRPMWISVDAYRTPDARCLVGLVVDIRRVDQLDDLIAFLQEVRG